MDARRRRAHPDHEAQAQADLGEVLGGDRGAVRGLSAEASNESLLLGRQVWEQFNRGSLAWDLADPEIVLATDPSWPDGGEFHGIEEYKRFMGQFMEAFEGIQFKEESDPEVIGELALFHGRWVGLGAASGIETASEPFWVVMRERAGKIAEARFFFDEEAARGAASAF